MTNGEMYEMGRKMKHIDTERCWSLRVMRCRKTATLDIMEDHDAADYDDPVPRVVIPKEAALKLATQLIKFAAS